MRAIRRRAAPRAEVRPLNPSSQSTGGFRRADVEPAPAVSQARRSGAGSPVPDRPARASAGWQRLRRNAPSAPRRARRRRHSRAPTIRDRPPRQHAHRTGHRARRVSSPGHRPAQRDKRDRSRQLHGAGSFDHGRQRRRAVEPRRLKQEVVIGGNRREATCRAASTAPARRASDCPSLPNSISGK